MRDPRTFRSDKLHDSGDSPFVLIMQPLFIALQKFGPARGAAWTSYVSWSGLTQLDELVSLDPILCPTVLHETKQEYWPHIVNENFMLHYFTDLGFLLQEVSAIPEKNLLCVFKNPSFPPIPPADLAFEFLGYDLIDITNSASALSNCGGFANVFAASELTDKGLLASHSRAFEVQRELLQNYPREEHANCNVWAVFRAAES